MLHKNSQKRIHVEGGEYFITCKTKDNIPFFREEIFCELWIEELKLCKEVKQFALFGFCLNHDHFHLMLRPEKENISEVMRSLKTNFSRNANRILGFSNMPKSKNIYLKARSRDRAFRVLEHFEAVKKLKTRFIKKYGERHSLQKFLWQKSFHDHLIRGDQDFDEHLGYTVENFLKHGLPSDWRYTSMNYPDLIDV